MASKDSDQQRPSLLWRYKDSRQSSVTFQGQSQPYCGFGWDAPIIDFYDNGYITEFAPLSDVLENGPEKIMHEAFKKIGEEQFPDQNAFPLVGRQRMRWVHVPANNMEWVERVIKCIWRAKNLKRAAESKTSAQHEDKHTTDTAGGFDEPAGARTNDMANVDDDHPLCLRPEYWRDHQRGCIEHCASNPLYARHMVPFFAPIPTGLDKSPTSKSENKPGAKANKSAKAGKKSTTHIMAEKANMVLFMPYLHWATSGHLMAERNALIRGLAKAFKFNGYRRPSYEEVDKMNIPPKLKMMKAFLFPDKDRCLHIRRTLDQFYYSTLPQDLADERTMDQVVYRFAMKQHQKTLEEKRQEMRRISKRAETESHSNSSDALGDTKAQEIVFTEHEIIEHRREEPPWDPPKVMMVNQLWMWVIDGDTVVTSFPAKLKSDLDHFKEKSRRSDSQEKPLDGNHRSDYTKGDAIYDSTDIWRAVFRELRLNTPYGKRSQKSALDLAWTIADQAAAVFHKRNLHPHLQFIEMFEMEINEIAFKQAEAFDTFSANVQLAHITTQLGKILSSLDFFQKEMIPIKHANEWREKFGQCVAYFKRKLEHIANGDDPNFNLESRPKTSGKRMYIPLSHVEEDIKGNQTFPEELNYEFRRFLELIGNAPTLKVIMKSLDAANIDLDAAITSLDSLVPDLDTTDDEIDSATIHLEQASEMLDEAVESLKVKLVNLYSAKEHLEYAISSLDTAKDHLNPPTIHLVADNLDFAKAHIEFAKYDLNYDIVTIVTFFETLFKRLEARVEEAKSTSTLNSSFHAFIQTAKKSLDAYTEVVMDSLPDVRMETSLVREIKDIIDELNMINAVKRQQNSVMEPFRTQMPHSVSSSRANRQWDFYDFNRLSDYMDELHRTAESVYIGLRDLTDLKQKEASAIEARSAGRDAKASAAQAEASTSLSAETVRQGWSIMVFTIVTIVFLPLSFFTSLFGMQAKELQSGTFTFGFYSAIMWPISFIVTCISLGLALNIEFRLLAHLGLRKILRYTGLGNLWRICMRFFMGAVVDRVTRAIEREKMRRASSAAYKKWETGL